MRRLHGSIRLVRLSVVLSITGAVLLIGSSAKAQFTSFTAEGANSAAIQGTVDNYRAALGGGAVAGANGSFGGIRREINWDGVPNNLSDPNTLPADFFNTTSPRGVVFSTPGTGFLVSANEGQGTPIMFGFQSDFTAFSGQKLFTAVNSNITDVSFFVPGTNTAATVSGFGSVFTDVETANQTKIDYFDVNNNLISSVFAGISGNQGLAFVGATSLTTPIARVRITSGLNTISANGTLGNPNDDVVVMDDFIYGEPVAITANAPEPGALALLALGAVPLGIVARRRR